MHCYLQPCLTLLLPTKRSELSSNNSSVDARRIMNQSHETQASHTENLPQPLKREEEEEAQQPKYDNFYTPRNHDFYSNFQYADLAPVARCIRLLRMHPPTPADNISAPVRCDLLDDVPMQEIAGNYTTLSYCAGDPKKTEVIVVNGTEFNAFANLGHALRQARHFWRDKFEKQELLLWADQVCINQSNSIERAHQVEMMGDIYENGEQVLICLSKEGDLPGGIKWLHDYIQNLSLKNRWPYPKKDKEHDLQDYYRTPQNFLLASRWKEIEFHLGFDAFMKIMLRSVWWTRVWVQQEFLRSRQAFLIAASEVIQWKALLAFLTSYEWRAFASEHARLPELDHESGQFSLTSITCEACAFGRMPQYIVGATTRAFNILSMKERKESWTGQFPDLVNQLKIAYLFDSTDPRDMIYARLGISKRYHGLTPDYSPTVSFQDVLTQLAHHIISKDNNLAIIQWGYQTKTHNSDPDIPSWVPDCELAELFATPGVN